MRDGTRARMVRALRWQAYPSACGLSPALRAERAGGATCPPSGSGVLPPCRVPSTRGGAPGIWWRRRRGSVLPERRTVSTRRLAPAYVSGKKPRLSSCCRRSCGTTRSMLKPCRGSGSAWRSCTARTPRLWRSAARRSSSPRAMPKYAPTSAACTPLRRQRRRPSHLPRRLSAGSPQSGAGDRVGSDGSAPPPGVHLPVSRALVQPHPRPRPLSPATIPHHFAAHGLRAKRSASPAGSVSRLKGSVLRGTRPDGSGLRGGEWAHRKLPSQWAISFQYLA